MTQDEKTQKVNQGASRKIFTNFLSGKDENGQAFSCQIDLTPTSGNMPDEFWTAILNALVDVQIMTEEEMNGQTETAS